MPATVTESVAIAPNGRVFDLPAIVGIEEGIFERHGLDVRFSATYADRPRTERGHDEKGSGSCPQVSPATTRCSRSAKHPGTVSVLSISGRMRVTLFGPKVTTPAACGTNADPLPVKLVGSKAGLGTAL